MEKRLCIKAVRKAFGNKVVLDNLSCDFPAGKVYALLGENGAGKSTLASLINGEKTADAGTIDFQNINSCALVHQRPLLADRLNIRDNIILGSEPLRTPPSVSRFAPFLGFIDFKYAQKRIDTLIREWNLPIRVHDNVAPLSAQERFFTAFAASLYKNPDVLILDEPGAVLSGDQKRKLYTSLHDYAESGKIVILITHNMNDALEFADGILVLRAGQKPVFVNCAERSCGVDTLCASHIEKLVFGSACGATDAYGILEPHNPQAVSSAQTQTVQNSVERNTGETPLLSVHNLSCTPDGGSPLHNINFSVYAGSITCIFGYRENGLETLENLLTGMKKLTYTGRITLGGNSELSASARHKNPRTENKKEMPEKGPVNLRAFGAGIVPFNRTFRASNPALTVEQILTVYLKPQDAVTGADYAQSLITRAGIHIGTAEQASALSGGMLQRLIIEREIDAHKKLLILCEPERGLDINAAAALVRRLQRAADEGTGILLFMSAGNPVKFDCRFRYFLRGGCLHEA